ncbi:hypothetical protein Tco_1350334, partial [Tanacetum coccineum]
KPELRPNKDFEAKYNKVKAKLALLSSSTSSKPSMVKNKGLVAKAYEWDEKDVSSDDTNMTEVKVLMALLMLKMLLLAKRVPEMHVNTEILKKNKNLRKELKDLTAITETWLNNSNKVNQYISEQIPSQKKRILGLDQLTEDPSSSWQTDLVFVKSSTEDTKVSIPGIERPSFSEARGFTFPNHDTSRILPTKSQVTITDPSVAITDSSATEYDSADESSVCSTPLPLLEKIVGGEPISGPKTIKSILKSNLTFKPETLKGDTINEPSSAPVKDNKHVSASKRNSAPTGKLKNVNIEDDIPLSNVMKELNHLKSQGGSSSRSKTSRPSKPFSICIHCGVISLGRGIKPRNPQQVTKGYETCGSTVHIKTDHNDIEWFRRSEALQAKKAEAF